ncbi:MAG: hypothetical protein J07HQW2_01222 [Haloquadratum walsbyi J07HQW2]|jgi:hypothetical protein|uniref:Uncharacterized protein n=1 Tax=Haloquadratum walsbyi J07HQW2 TaxID=1238425 RepID=U1NCW6_9EURY|nr:MAG: hypothetical protein J07HQW2_01222 [Haloquadratum walsbyi J07HQW2]
MPDSPRGGEFLCVTMTPATVVPSARAIAAVFAASRMEATAGVVTTITMSATQDGRAASEPALAGQCVRISRIDIVRFRQ